MAEQKRKRTQGRRADYRKATPRQAVEAAMRVRVKSGMKPKRFVNPNR